MLKVLSFNVAGGYGAFRDPSVTSNQTVYYIPSKTSVIGMIGAILGVERGHGINETYSKQYLELFSKTKIGLKLESKPEKVSFFTNHRSLKEAKTKPFKTELTIQPKYKVFVSSDRYDILESLFDAISLGRYEYPPYLGHAYCPATVSEPVIHEANEYNGLTYQTSSVILDESEPYDGSFALEVEPDTETSSLIIERHLHHFMEGDQLKARVLKHWIPELESSFRVSMSKKPKLSQVVSLGENNNNNKFVCLY
jgi:CRISPR-associated protein Cas5h